MTREDLIQNLAESGFSYFDATKAVKCIFESMANALSSGEEVKIRGFAQFRIVKRRQRKAQNLQTLETITLPQRSDIKVKINKEIKNKLNDK